MIRTMLRAALAAVVVGLAACGGGTDTCQEVTGGTACGGNGGGGGGGTAPVASDLVLVLSAATIPNDGTQTVLATATALDASRNTLEGVPVTISVDQNAIATVSGSETDSSGVISAAIGIGSDDSNRTITVTARSGGLSRTASLDVRDPVPGGGTSGPTLNVALSTAMVTAQTPATVTVTARSASGSPLSGVVVGLATSRGNLATLARASVLTDVNGSATTTLNANDAGVSGADQVLATATVGATSVSGSAGFTVQGASPTLVASPATVTLRQSSGPLTITGTLRNAAGIVVPNVPVTLASANERVVFDSSSVLTSGTGVATTTVTPVVGSPTTTDVITMSASVDGRTVTASINVQVIAESHSVAMTLSNSAVTATTPATATVRVVDALGAPVGGTVVEFSSQFGLVTFGSSTALTDALGVATMNIAPRASSSSGADVIEASVTLLGVRRSDQDPVQVSSGAPAGAPVIALTLNRTSISAAAPATVTATLTDASGAPVPGQVVAFAVARGLATTNVPTALTNTQGQAVAVLSPTTSSSAGADEITAALTYAGTALQASRGFEVQATNATISSFVASTSPLSAYGQTPLTLNLTGASVTTPVNITITSSCVALGKATLSPATVSATSNTATVQYRDEGCGAVQPEDQLLAVIDGTATSGSLVLPIDRPAESSIAFVGSNPEVIYLKGSGLTESSVVTFQVRDAAGNPLPGRTVEMRLLTGAGGVLMEGRGVESVDPLSSNPFTQESNALGQVSARVNSGTVPTPVRIHAKIRGTSIATVSSNLSVAAGLPSQLNFSMSQGTRNIEGFNIDGTPNTYQIIAADRSGNPIPDGTSVNFVTEGGQVEAIGSVQNVGGIARTVVNFVSAEPRPVDGRVTITAYALGEESFIDLNGDNLYSAGEPFQDLGNIFRDRNYDGVYDSAVDEFIPLAVNNSSACAAPASDLLRLNASIPSMSIASGNATDTCDNRWSGAGQVYVRRAVETVLSTSAARPLWRNTSGLCVAPPAIPMQDGPNAANQSSYDLVTGVETWHAGSGGSTLSFIVADANPGDAAIGQLPRLNPMAAGTSITATATPGLTVQVGGTPVPSTTEASLASVAVTFVAANEGTVFVSFTSPSGLRTTVPIGVTTAACP